jgi:hypothetical protein
LTAVGKVKVYKEEDLSEEARKSLEAFAEMRRMGLTIDDIVEMRRKGMSIDEIIEHRRKEIGK